MSNVPVNLYLYPEDQVSTIPIENGNLIIGTYNNNFVIHIDANNKRLGQSGGAVYSEGDGIDISDNDVISVDSTIARITDVPNELADLSSDSTHRLVTDTEKSTWNGKQNALTFPLSIANGGTGGTTVAAARANLDVLKTVMYGGYYPSSQTAGWYTIFEFPHYTMTLAILQIISEEYENSSAIVFINGRYAQQGTYYANQSPEVTLFGNANFGTAGGYTKFRITQNGTSGRLALDIYANGRGANLRVKVLYCDVTDYNVYSTLTPAVYSTVLREVQRNFLDSIETTGNISLRDSIYMRENAYIHTGSTPKEADNWSDFLSNSGVSAEDGINICQGMNETSGIHMDGETVVMWSPCDEGALWYYDTDSGDVIFHIDEDGNYYDRLGNKISPQVNSDWNATSGVSRILNKPTLATVATSGSYNDLSNRPTLGTAAAKGITDSTSASALIRGTNLTTERDVYYGTPLINNSHSYTSDSNYYAPTSAGTSGEFLQSSGGTSAPVWRSLAAVATSGSYRDLSNQPDLSGKVSITGDTMYGPLYWLDYNSYINCNKVLTPTEHREMMIQCLKNVSDDKIILKSGSGTHVKTYFDSTETHITGSNIFSSIYGYNTGYGNIDLTAIYGKFGTVTGGGSNVVYIPRKNVMILAVVSCESADFFAIRMINRKHGGTLVSTNLASTGTSRCNITLDTDSTNYWGIKIASTGASYPITYNIFPIGSGG